MKKRLTLIIQTGLNSQKTYHSHKKMSKKKKMKKINKIIKQMMSILKDMSIMTIIKKNKNKFILMKVLKKV